MSATFNYNETLLALTTLVAWADGENHPSEVDTRVTMILHEGIGNDELEDFQEKYNEIGDLDKVFEVAITSLKLHPVEGQAKAIAWMWQVANVSTNEEDEEVDLGYIDENWVNRSEYVALNELVWINKTRKALGVDLDLIKSEFMNLPATKRIYDSPN